MCEKCHQLKLDTEEEKTAWGHYSSGYLNAQQDVLRAGWTCEAGKYICDMDCAHECGKGK